MKNIEKDHKGFTLVELLVSMAISTIIILSLTYIFNYSNKNYQKASTEVSLQTESQTVLNQLSALIIEAYNVKYDSAGILTVHQDDYKYIIWLDLENQQLNFEQYNISGDRIGKMELLGRYVTSFSVTDTGSDNQNNQIKISLNFKNGSHTYEIRDQIIILRNQIKPVP